MTINDLGAGEGDTASLTTPAQPDDQTVVRRLVGVAESTIAGDDVHIAVAGGGQRL
ncbi:hypothetical protein [Streptomyces geranii]|uniref:hypothetical protein n=1 Tax=Streptomyces geranii TaxID=2058923 RepID=UPI0018E59D17|nr:hypothetical protein [Streptomyces geranii]